MLSDKVKNVIVTDIVSIDENETVYDAGKAMSKNKIGAVIVMDANKKPVGIFTERDYVHTVSSLFKEEKRLDEAIINPYMSKPVISINGEASIQKAADRMYHKKIRRLLIVDDGGDAIGFCSLKDILEANNEDMNGY